MDFQECGRPAYVDLYAGPILHWCGVSRYADGSRPSDETSLTAVNISALGRRARWQKKRPMPNPEDTSKDQPKLNPDRYMQAKTFLENGVITKEQFLEMTHGQADLEEACDADSLAALQKSIAEIDQRQRRMEIMLAQIKELLSAKE